MRIDSPTGQWIGYDYDAVDNNERADYLQLTSDPNPDFHWGDGGHFYFYIRRDALIECDFSDLRIVFEN